MQWPQFNLVNSVRAVLALVLVAPLVVTAQPWPETLFPYVVGKALWTRTLIEVAFGLWLILILRNPAYRPPRYWLLGLFALYLLAALLAGVFGVSFNRSLWSTYERMTGWVALAHWFGFALMLVSVFRTWAHWRALLNFNIGVGFVLGILVLAEQFEWGWFPHYLNPIGDRRAATFGNPTYLGGFAAVNVFTAAAFLGSSFIRRTGGAADPPSPAFADSGRRRSRQQRRQQRRRERPAMASAIILGLVMLWAWRAFWASAIILGLVMLWWSGTRGAMAGMGGGIAAFGAAYALWGPSRQWRMAGAGVFVGAVALGGTALAIAGINPASALREGFGAARAESISERIIVNRVAVDGFLARPVLGWGPDNFSIAYERHAPPAASAHKTTYFDQSHNKVLEELATTGFLGTAAYLAMWGYLLVVFVRKTRFLDSDKRLFAVLAGAGLATYFGQNLFLFDTPGTLPQFLMLMGFVVFIDSLPLRDAREPAWGRGLWDGWRRMLAATGRGTGAAVRAAGLNGILGMGFAALLVAAVMFFFNARVYTASQSALHVLNPQANWNMVFTSFEDAVTTFPPLGNDVRLWLMHSMDRKWFDLVNDPGQLHAALGLIERFGGQGTALEPENHRLYTGTAAVFQRAAAYSEDYYQEYTPRARQMADRAGELAPDWFDVRRLLMFQEALENGNEAAEQELERYVAEAPEMAPRLYTSMADFYQRNADESPENLDRARDLLLRAIALSPDMNDPRRVLVVVETLQRGPEAGLAELERHVAEKPDMAPAFAELRNILNSSIAEQQGAGAAGSGQ